LPTLLYVLLAVQVPVPPDSFTVPVDVDPSPHATVHVCVSAVPGSLKEALTDTDVPVLKTAPPSGLVILTVGATFATVTEKLAEADAPVESLTVTLTVYAVDRSFT
jgi:hypothetical protein